MAPTKSQKRQKELDDTENLIQMAVMGCKTGAYKSPRDAAQKLGIPWKESTIYRRGTGRTLERRHAHSSQQLLSPPKETALVQWAAFAAATGHPLSKRTIGPKVYELCGKYPSRRWVRSFLGRHPELRLGRPTGLDTKRAQAFNESTVAHHMDLLQKQFDLALIPVTNLHNVDEIGIQPNGGRNGTQEHFFYTQSDRARYRIKSGEQELVTVLESVCADGTAPVKPCFVFQGKLFCREWASVDNEILLATTDTGWTNDQVFLAWLEKCFIPHAKAHANPDFPILLMYDGHGSHSTYQVIELARKHNVILYCLPPHTTHRLQPCDVGAFGPLKRHWQQSLKDYYHNEGVFLPIRDVVKVYMEARTKAFQSATIQAAWRRSGIDVSSTIPRTVPSTFTKADFMTSIPTSTHLHLPTGFPLRVPEEMTDFASSSEDGEDDDGLDAPGSDVAPGDSITVVEPVPFTSTPLNPTPSRSEPAVHDSAGYDGDVDGGGSQSDEEVFSDTSDEEDYDNVSADILKEKLRKYKAKHAKRGSTFVSHISELIRRPERVLPGVRSD